MEKIICDMASTIRPVWEYWKSYKPYRFQGFYTDQLLQNEIIIPFFVACFNIGNPSYPVSDTSNFSP